MVGIWFMDRSRSNKKGRQLNCDARVKQLSLVDDDTKSCVIHCTLAPVVIFLQRLYLIFFNQIHVPFDTKLCGWPHACPSGINMCLIQQLMYANQLVVAMTLLP